MDISFAKWLPEQAMDQDNYPTLNNIDQRSSQSNHQSHGDFNFQAFNNIISKSNKPPLPSSANFSQLITFEDSSNSLQMLNNIQNLKYCNMMKKQQHEELCSDDHYQNLNNTIAVETLTLHHHHQPGQDNIRMTMRSPLQAREHVLAERKRREKLNQQFIALSAIIPGIKKMNKASVLEGTIKYLKGLQEKEKKLVELTKKKPPQLLGVNFDERCCGHEQSDDHLPRILARVSEKNVLLRIHCKKQINRCIAKILHEIEKLHLMVINSSTIPFGDYAMVITVVAQMEVELCISVKDLMQKLRLALLEFL